MAAGPSTPKPAAATARDDADGTHGNFQVVTSDGEFLMVDDYVLYWASSVFANARSHADDKEIEFTDERFETAEVFRLFLSLATTLDPLFEFLPITPLVTNLLLFLRKWDCRALYAAVVKALFGSFRHDTFHRIYPLQLFELGALLDDVSVCKVAITEHMRGRGFDRWWDGNLAKTPFDPQGWTASFWRENEIPRDYLFALMLSWHAKGWEDRTLANKFETELKAVQRPVAGMPRVD